MAVAVTLIVVCLPSSAGRAYGQGLGTPAPAFTRYLAEGATSSSLDTQLAIVNPGSVDASATLTFSRAVGAPVVTQVHVPARTRITVVPKTITGLASAEFSTVIASDQLLVVDRTMSWDARAYGAHAETAVAAPASTWYLAEGSTVGAFNLFYLLQNPNPAEAVVRVRFLRPNDPPLEKTYVLPPNSRSNIWVNREDFPGLGKALAATDVSAVVESRDDRPIIVERALYLDLPGQVFGAGHESAGVTEPATQWYLAEGATGDFLDLFVLVANPGDTDAIVEATYLLPNGSAIVKPYTIPANRRVTIWVDHEDPRLADTAVSTTVRSTNGVRVIVERALWWPEGFGHWYEAHNSPGSTSTGTRWAMAEGEVGGTRGTDTYILVANTSPTTGSVTVTLLFEGGTSDARTFQVAGNSRFNVDVRAEFPAALDKRFGAIVESTGNSPARIVVERAMYWDALGQPWAAGTNALATLLPDPVPSLPSEVSISARQLILRRRNPDGTLASPVPFVIKAVNWSPAGRSTATSPADIDNVVKRRPEFGAWYLADIPLMKAMHVNTVRLFMDPGLPGDAGVTVPGLDIMDELYRNGIMVIMTVDNGNNTAARIQPVVAHYRNHPAILMWSLASEFNINRFWKHAEFPTVEEAAQAIERAAQLVKSVDTLHPVAASYGSIVNMPNAIEHYVDTVCPTVDVWSFNEYRGPGFARLFDQWRYISHKPMFLGEYGIDAYDSTRGDVDVVTHAAWVSQLWDELARNLSATAPDGVSLGGAIMEWNDEWWKSGHWSTQDVGGWTPLAFPDRAASEDYWGIVTIDRVPRLVHGILTTRFAPGYVPPPAPASISYRAESLFPGTARFWEDGALSYDGVGFSLDGGRGFNIAAIDLAGGHLIAPIQRFDTWKTRWSGDDMRAMNTFLDGVPDGTLLLIAVGDEAGLTGETAGPDSPDCSPFPYPWVDGALTRLSALGSAMARRLCYQEQWAFIAIKGQGVALAEARGTGVGDAVAQARVPLR